MSQADGHNVDNTTEDPVETPKVAKVADVIDKTWCEKVSQNQDFRANSVEEPKAKAHQWYANICSSILEVADKILPRKISKKVPRRDTSQRTKYLFSKRQRMTRRNSSKRQFKDIQSKIKESCLKDFNDWVDSCVKEMESANKLGDVRRIYHLVKKLSNKPKPPPTNLTKDEDGTILKGPSEKVVRWEKFLTRKFEATPEESKRPPMPPLTSVRTSDDILTRSEFDRAMKRMKISKATGPDDVPIEVFKKCPQLADELFNFMVYVWDNEVLPTNMAVAKFVMLYKHKGSTNDPSKYRCIGLLNHSYKLLTNIMLERLLLCSESFLKDWQAGFRTKRGCRDNSMILRTVCQRMIELGESIAITFVDYSAAFDTVSHKFLDEALEAAGAPVKIRALFRAIYDSASAYTTIPGTDGSTVSSSTFPINRGVLQGDITSPLYFILALELILRKYDSRVDKGVQFADVLLHTLGYADDVALIETGDAVGIERLSERVSALREGSKKSADMDVNIVKTKALHVRQQEGVTKTTQDEARAKCKFACPHPGCGHVFLTKRGRDIHAGRCQWQNEFVVERILNHKGPTTARQYLIRWHGYSSQHDSWVPRSNIHPEAIKDYEIQSGSYVQNWRFRCPDCDLPCKLIRGIKIHQSKAHKPTKSQSFEGRLADGAVQVSKMEALQKERPTIYCGDSALDNVFKFVYLGTIFAANGLQCYDVDARVAMAMSRCGKLRHIFDSPHISFSPISLKIKLRLYEAAVCSLLTYGCETWDLDVKTLRRINGANSTMLARFTGQSIPVEARPLTTSFNLTKKIRERRLRWLGHIVRAGPSSIMYQALMIQHEMGHTGNLLMDTPPHNSIDDLRPIANDRCKWKSLARNLQ